VKEDMLEVLMYLFDNYIVDGLNNFEPSQDEIAKELAGAGFQSEEISKAFVWLEDLLEISQQAAEPNLLQSTLSLRIYTTEENEKLGRTGQQLLNRLVNLGVLNQFSREMVIDRVMALESIDVDIDHIRWVALMVLSNQPGFDQIAEWAEVIVTEGSVPVIH
jgi:Smg protein